MHACDVFQFPIFVLHVAVKPLVLRSRCVIMPSFAEGQPGADRG